MATLVISGEIRSTASDGAAAADASGTRANVSTGCGLSVVALQPACAKPARGGTWLGSHATAAQQSRLFALQLADVQVARHSFLHASMPFAAPAALQPRPWCSPHHVQPCPLYSSQTHEEFARNYVREEVASCLKEICKVRDSATRERLERAARDEELLSIRGEAPGPTRRVAPV